MSGPFLRFAAAGVLLLTPGRSAEPAKPAPEPKLTSAHPFSIETGRECEVIFRGTALLGARSLVFPAQGIASRILRTADGEIAAGVTVPPEFAGKALGVRTMTAGGITNEVKLQVSAVRTSREGDPIAGLPAVINGTIARRGETDSFWYEAKADETISIEVLSGFPGFDPAISIWAPAPSWLDAARMERTAFQDEPLYFPGLDTTARLSHRFAKAGRHAIRVAAFGGQGGPDFAYTLRITRGEAAPPNLHPTGQPEWPERWFTRKIGPEWLAALPRRGNEKPLKAIESYRAVPEGSPDVPVIEETGLVEGRLGRADEAHEIRLRIAEPRDLAIEIETPEATMPRFNPVVRVMQPDGHEVVTNVYTKLNNNGLYMMKMIQAKTTVTLRSVGDYRIQIRDITSDCWSKDFAYRVLFRPQVPHLGEVTLTEDRVNLEPGQSKPLTVNADREEGFKGFVAISVEGLPPGVSAVTGLENPVEKPPLPNAGRRERYYPIPQTATVMLAAAPDAEPGREPTWARVIVRPVVNGRMGEPVLTKRIPVLVTARR